MSDALSLLSLVLEVLLAPLEHFQSKVVAEVICSLNFEQKKGYIVFGQQKPMRLSPAGTEMMYYTECGSCWINLMVLCEYLHKAGGISKMQKQ